jgi:histidyl-tRNA synthetase
MDGLGDLGRTLALCGLENAVIARDRLEDLSARGGAYLLLVELPQPLQTEIARLGQPYFPAGSYIYAGSAFGPGGIAARVRRHFRTDKTRRWHIDSLTGGDTRLGALVFREQTECQLIERLLSHPEFAVPVPGFGSTDCSTCPSHLLRWSGG